VEGRVEERRRTLLARRLETCWWVRRVRPGDGCGGGEVEVFSLVLSV
jgi:hypothetical protein